MADKQVHLGHRARLRERALSEGLDGFHPHQILELLLFYVIPRQDTSEPAHLLIDRFGTVQAVLTAPVEELVKVRGVGKRTAQWLHNLGELMESYIALRPEDRPRIVNFQSAFDYCQIWGKMYQGPQTFLLCLTPDGAIQSFSHLCDSLEWGDADVLKRALDDVLSVHARNVIVVEFVEGEPDVEDREIQRAEDFAYVLRVMGAELLDVVLVGAGQVVSLNQSGYFDRGRFGEAMSILSEHYLREDAGRIDYEGELPLNDNGL